MTDRYRLACPLVPEPVSPSRPGPQLWLAAGDDSGSDDTIQVQRRRPSGPSAGPRQRAEAPERHGREDGPGDSGGGPPGGSQGGSGLPGGALPLGGCGGLIVLILIVAIMLLKPGAAPAPETELPATASAGQPSATVPRPTPRPQPTVAPLAAGALTAAPVPTRRLGSAAPLTATPRPAQSRPGQRWTVLLYEDADDKILDEDMTFDLNEAERAGSTDQVNVVAEIKRYRAARGNTWTGAKRFLVQHDDDLNRISSQELADLGNVNMSDPRTLVDFATWAIQKYPADRYVLILSDHGMGWPGGWTDASHENQAPSSKAPLASAIGNLLYLSDLDQALGQIRAQTGLDKFELIGMDACLMSQVEVYAALAPHGRYAVASEETEPALGWAYAAFLSALENNPAMSGADLGRAIVQTYIRQDERIVDERARADYMRQGSPMGGFFQSVGAPAAEQLAQELGDDITLTAIDLGALPPLLVRLDQFAFALQGVDQGGVARARTYAQAFTSVFGSKVPPSYIDLGHFATLAAGNANNAQLTAAAQALQAALRAAVLAERHGPKKPGATGVAIYFPNSKIYSSVAGPQSYTAIAARFAGASKWPNFLASHYTGRRFTLTTHEPAVPDRAAAVKGPGIGQIQVSPVRLSSNTAAPGQSITMKADVTGSNVGYVYFFTGYYDRKSNSLNVADTDFLESPQSRQLNGVYYPDWGGRNKFTLQFDWEPLMFAISDGQTRAQVLLQPQSYGVAREQAVYTVDGTYTYSSGETRSARLFFSNGLLRHVIGFSGSQADGSGAAREITPQAGDRFTVLEKWLDLDANGQARQTVLQPGKTLTFGSQTFTWQELDAAAGNYVAGFIVEDLDGNTVQSFAPVRVQ